MAAVLVYDDEGKLLAEFFACREGVVRTRTSHAKDIWDQVIEFAQHYRNEPDATWANVRAHADDIPA